MTLPVLKLNDDNGKELIFTIATDGAMVDGVNLQKKDVLNIAATLRTLENIPKIGEAPNLKLPDFVLGRNERTFKITTTGPSIYNVVVNNENLDFTYQTKITREYVFSIELAEQLSEIIMRLYYQCENQNSLLSKSTPQIKQEN